MTEPEADGGTPTQTRITAEFVEDIAQTIVPLRIWHGLSDAERYKVTRAILTHPSVITCVNSHAELEAKAKLYPELVRALSEVVRIHGDPMPDNEARRVMATIADAALKRVGH